MKKHLISLFAVSIVLLSACSSNDDSSSSNASQDRIVGEWESWKEVTDDGETFELIENGCATYQDSYNANGNGSEKYLSSWSDCEIITSDAIKWQSLGNDNYKISSADGSFSETHHFTFVDDNTLIQRDEENQSNIYFRKRPTFEDPIIGKWGNPKIYKNDVLMNGNEECTEFTFTEFFSNGISYSETSNWNSSQGCVPTISDGTWQKGENGYILNGVNSFWEFTFTTNTLTITSGIDTVVYERM